MNVSHYVVSVVLIGVLSLSLAHGVTAEEKEQVITFTRLAVDQDGESYFIDESQGGSKWPSGKVIVSLEESSDSVRFFKAEHGWEMLDFHHAPRRQYLFVLYGTLEIHTSKNQVKQFGQGSVLLVEDTYGKGHRTRNAGDRELLLAWVSLDQ